MAADIHALELEFAKNPTLDACIPLCQAYLSQKRFMEAMVVSKKGIKGSPADPRGPVLLARVYFEQGKLPKAEQELTTALQQFPGYPPAFEMMGAILVQQGRQQEAVPLLQQAAAADASLVTARALLQQLGVAVPAAQRPAVAAGGGARPAPAQPRPAAPPQMAPQMAPQQAMPAPPQGAWGNAAPQMQAPVAPGAMPPPGGAPKLEHVSDFFADETLGFRTDASHIETAGPGRLTILGFVPKSSGSLKTTIFVALALLAVASTFVFFQYVNAVNTRKINKLFGEMRTAMDEDKYARYQDALHTGDEILKINPKHNLTLSAMAYAEAILASEHSVSGSAELSQNFLRRAIDTGEQDNEFRVAAQALLHYYAKKYEQGLSYVKQVQAKGGSNPLMDLEAFRLMREIKPDDKETQVQLARVVGTVTGQARILNFLGWYYYDLNTWDKADRYFDQTLQNSKDHPMALVGQAMVDLGRAIGLNERQKEVAQRIKKVLSLPKDEVSQPVLAWTYFARALLNQFQHNDPEADADFKEAYKLDPDNGMFYYRRGQSMLLAHDYKKAVDALSKAVGMEPNNPRFYKGLGQAQSKAGDTDRAKASFERAAQLQPADFEVKLLDAERLVTDKKYDAAINRYKTVTKDDGGKALSLAQIGISQAFRASGRKDKAVKQMEAFMAELPASVGADTQAQLWTELGLCYDGQGNKDKAEQAYTNATEQFPYFAPPHFYLCRLHGRADGKQECKTYLALDPNGEFSDEAKRRSK